ncbi:MAG: hypothetical protein PHH28_01975 [Desulfuromonadaceae bacterium]|nr:hypothetical protein [Desulfuromonadaceae bacterium]
MSVVVSGLAQTLPPFLNEKSNSSPQGDNPQNSGVALSDKAIVADTVSFSSQPQQAGAVKEEAKKEQTKKVSSSEQSGSVMAKVQFVYNQKGDLSVRYMDAANRLIYQVPSELMMRMKEAASKLESPLDTKA